MRSGVIIAAGAAQKEGVEMTTEAVATKTKKKVLVKRYKGDNAAQRGIEKMLNAGWEIEGQSGRKQAWSPVTGVFTRKQVHTITFVKDVEVKPLTSKQRARRRFGWRLAVILWAVVILLVIVLIASVA